MFAVVLVSFLLQDKDSIKKNRDFFNQKNEFDVLFFGSSHMEMFINPMDLWNDFGITSYNFGSPEQSVAISYWSIVNAVNVHRPEVIVFDVTMIGHDTDTDEEHLHYAIDSFPMNSEKINAINDLIDNRNEQLEMVFPIGNYHGRWKNLSKDDFSLKSKFVKGSLSYGFANCMNVMTFPNNELTDEIGAIDENSEDIVYLNKIIDFAKEQDINLVLTATPSVCSVERQKIYNAISEIARKKDIPFIDFISMDSVIDMKIDLYDYEHVNQSGVHKVTHYIGSYLQKEFELANHSGDDRFSRWDKDYEDYMQLKMESILWNADNIQIMFQALHDKDLNSIIFLGKDADISGDKEVVNDLLQNICRENISYGEESTKSYQKITLNLVEDSLNNADYLVECSNGNVISERIELNAVETINGILTDLSVSSEDVVVAVFDARSGELKLVRSYQEYGYTDLYSDIKKFYF